MNSLGNTILSRSQIATLNKGRGYNIKYLPYSFNELDVAMLSSVLKSKIAINVNRVAALRVATIFLIFIW